MSDIDKKRFYWLKLKKDFFHQHQIRVLKSLPNGRLYALIYLELLAESTSHDGELRYSQLLPYDIITLSAVIDEDKDNVEKAIETLIKLELVEILDDGTIFMREIERLIGSETGSAIRKREYRKSVNGTLSQKCLLENRDKSIEIRDKNIYSEPTHTKKPTKHKYGEYKHVLLTEEQHTQLLNDLGETRLNEYIKRVDEYVQMKGKTYKDYNLTIRNWLRRDGIILNENTKGGYDDGYFVWQGSTKENT